MKLLGKVLKKFRRKSKEILMKFCKLLIYAKFIENCVNFVYNLRIEVTLRNCRKNSEETFV